MISRCVVYTETIPPLSHLRQLDLLKFQAFLPFHERSGEQLGRTLSSSPPPAINSLGLSLFYSSPLNDVKLFLHLAPCLYVLVIDEQHLLLTLFCFSPSSQCLI